MKDRPLFSRRDLLFFSLLAVLCAAGFLLSALAPQGASVVAEQNGTVLFTRRLSEIEEPETIELAGENGISLTILLQKDGAQVQSSTCPDQICVRTGKISKAGESALCLPARVSIRMEGGGPDAATY